MAAQSAVGHRSVPHTADLRIEAWAPSRERCVAEAVAAMVGSFVDMSDARPVADVDFRVDSGTDEDVLRAVLDKVIYLMDITGQVPAGTAVAAVDGGLEVRLRMADPDRARMVGAVPKAVSLHELRLDSGEAGWSCGVTLDV